ncbi:unnamed protein product, partial [Adineta ricciae]
KFRFFTYPYVARSWPYNAENPTSISVSDLKLFNLPYPIFYFEKWIVVLPNKQLFCKNYWPFTLLCCFLYIPGLVAIVVVLSLIPVYLSTNPISGTTINSFLLPYNVTYGTNFKSDSVSAIPNLNSLATQLMNQYSNTDISVITTLFISTESNASGKRRRETRSTNEQCEVNPNTTGDLLFVAFIVKPRFSCLLNGCRKNFNETFEKVTAIIRSQALILLTLANGSTIMTETVFCSTGQVKPVELTTIVSTTKATTTTSITMMTTTTTTTTTGILFDFGHI